MGNGQNSVGEVRFMAVNCLFANMKKATCRWFGKSREVFGLSFGDRLASIDFAMASRKHL